MVIVLKCHLLYALSVSLCLRFRRQHEQLRQVIIRVLRPSTKGRTGTPGAEEQESKIEPVVDEAADANAIEVR